MAEGLAYRDGKDSAFPDNRAPQIGLYQNHPGAWQKYRCPGPCKSLCTSFCSPKPSPPQNHCLSGEQREITDEKRWRRLQNARRMPSLPVIPPESHRHPQL